MNNKEQLTTNSMSNDGLLWWLPERWVALVAAISGSVFLFTEVFIRGYAFFHQNAPIHPDHVMLNYVWARSGIIFTISSVLVFVTMELRRQIFKLFS